MNNIFDHIAGQVLGNKITDIPTNQQDTCGDTDNSLGVACDSAAGHAGRHGGHVAGSFHHLSWANKSDLSDAQKIELLRDALKAAHKFIVRVDDLHQTIYSPGLDDECAKALELTDAK